MDQRLLQSQVQAILQEDCNDGLIPRPFATRSLDLISDGNFIYPAVVLTCGEVTKTLRFPLTLPYQPNLREWLREAKVLFDQFDPTFPDYIVMIEFKGMLLEYVGNIERDGLSDFIEVLFTEGGDLHDKGRIDDGLDFYNESTGAYATFEQRP